MAKDKLIGERASPRGLRRQRDAALIGAFALLIVSGAAAAFALYSQSALSRVDVALVAQTEAPISMGARIARLRELAGYGGFIHNFKNYVIRRTPNYYSAAERDYGAAESLIDEWRDSGREDELAAALAAR